MKAAVVGGGAIGSVHAESYRNAGAEVVAIVDPLRELGSRVAEDFGAVWYPTLDVLLAGQSRPDVMSICTPPAFHRKLIEQALEVGVHVLCEKPMAHTLENARAIHSAALSAAARGVLFAMGYCHRLQPEIETIRTEITSGLIGKVLTFHNEFSGFQDDIEHRWFGRKAVSGGGVLIDAGIHSIDLFRYLCGEVVDASATMMKALDGVELDVEHTASLSLLSALGVVGSVDCSWKSPTGRAVVEVAGSLGALRFDYAHPGIVAYVKQDGAIELLNVADRRQRFDRELADFIAAARDGGTYHTGSFDGLMGLAVVDAVYTRRPVDVQLLAGGRVS